MAKNEPTGRTIPIEDRRRDDIEAALRKVQPGDRRTGVVQDHGKITGRDGGKGKTR